MVLLALDGKDGTIGLPVPVLVYNLLPLLELLFPILLMVLTRSPGNDRKGRIEQCDADLMQVLAVSCLHIQAPSAVNADLMVVARNQVEQVCSEHFLLIQTEYHPLKGCIGDPSLLHALSVCFLCLFHLLSPWPKRPMERNFW